MAITAYKRTALETRTAHSLDLRILAFMLVVATVQLFTGKRPFS
ncbi:hypothetical protein BH10ACI4_BH10ACI4_04920 [soil metagenome]